MNTKESLPHALGRKALDAMIRREYDGWPPKTQWSLYPTALKRSRLNQKTRAKTVCNPT